MLKHDHATGAAGADNAFLTTYYTLSEDDHLRLQMMFGAIAAIGTLCENGEGRSDIEDHHLGPLFWTFADYGKRIVDGLGFWVEKTPAH